MTKPSRNDPCPCGSGKKHKHCCLATSSGSAPAAAPNPLAEQAVAWFREAIALHNQGRLMEAADRYQRGLALNPEMPEMLSNLGSVLDALGQTQPAIAAYRKALTLKPGSVQVLNNLALAQQAAGDHAAAEANFRKALASDASYIPTHFNLGRLLQLVKRPQEAAASYRQMLKLAPDNAQAHSNLGGALEALGDFEGATAAYRQALALDPALVAARTGLDNTLGRLVPLWHIPMMNDTLRNEAYFTALRNAVTPQSRVFEIGTGSGLLSMMAASAGAASVTTCEAEPLVAAAAKQIIANNGYGDRIKQLAMKSTDVEIGRDLARPADILVSEIFSSELLGERVLSSIEDTKRRLLAPGCRVIPAAGSIMIGLYAGDDIGANQVVGSVCGFDLGHFNTIIPRRQTVARDDLQITLLSDDTPAFRFDFQNDDTWPPETKTLRIPVKTAGRCLGIIQWMFLEMDETTRFENHPNSPAAASSWTRCAYLLPQPVDVVPGQTAIVTVTHNRVYPWFTIEGFE